jgi:puromycin-sensitive aminopeptidase
VSKLVSGPRPAIKTDSPDQFRSKLRLPHFAKPGHYELHFRPNLVSYTFSGVVAVNVTVLTPTRFLVLNVVELIVDPASIKFKVYNGPPTCKEKTSSQKMFHSPHHIINLVLISYVWLLQCLVPTEVVFFKYDQIMVIGFQKELPVGEGVLRMHFNGTLNDETRGFFKRYEFLIAFFFLDISNIVRIMHA